MSTKRAVIVNTAEECQYRNVCPDGYWFLKDGTRTKVICGKMLSENIMKLRCDDEDFPAFCPLLVLEMDD